MSFNPAQIFQSGRIISEPNLILYYDAGLIPSYPQSGSSLKDRSGWANAANATLINSVPFTNANGGYLTTNGTNSYIDAGVQAKLNFGANNFTVEYWFMKLTGTAAFSNLWGVGCWNTGASPTTNNWVVGIGNGTTGTGNNYSFTLVSGAVGYGTGEITPVLALNQWYQLVCVREGNVLKTYLNNTLTRSITPTGFTAATAMNTNSRSFRISNTDINNFYTNARVAICRVYNKALSASEVSTQFNRYRSRFGL